MPSPIVLLDAGPGVLPLRSRPRRAVQLDGSTQYLSIDSNASVQSGDVGWAFSAWFYLDSKATNYGLAGKLTSFADREWQLFYSASDRISMIVSNGSGTNRGSVNSAALGSPPTGQWLCVTAYHDAVNNQVGMYVDDLAASTAATTGAMGTSSAPFSLGYLGGVGYLPGRADQAAWIKSPPGGIAAVIDDIHATLYGGGAGRRYEDLTSTQKADWGLVSFWQFDEMRGTRFDSHGTNHLSPTGSPTVALGIT